MKILNPSLLLFILFFTISCSEERSLPDYYTAGSLVIGKEHYQLPKGYLHNNGLIPNNNKYELNVMGSIGIVIDENTGDYSGAGSFSELTLISPWPDFLSKGNYPFELDSNKNYIIKAGRIGIDYDFGTSEGNIFSVIDGKLEVSEHDGFSLITYKVVIDDGQDTEIIGSYLGDLVLIP